jgi:RNA polymerase sigma factor (sigma-70 family)
MSLEKINLQLSLWWDETCQGDMQSFKMIHQHLFAFLLQYINGILKDDSLSKDILQDMFIKMWERKERFGPIQNVKGYFVKSARSMAFNQLKSAKIKSASLKHFIRPDVESSQEDILINEETNIQLQQQIARILNGLPKRQREILFLKYYDGWSYGQISEISGIKYQSVVNHVHRAVTQIRGELNGGQQQLNCRFVV